MRWHPYPTCRIPLRRFISSLLVLALLVPALPYRAEGADGPSVPDRASFCKDLDLKPGDIDSQGNPTVQVPEHPRLFKYWDDQFATSSQFHAGKLAPAQPNQNPQISQQAEEFFKEMAAVSEAAEKALPSSAAGSTVAAAYQKQQDFFSSLKNSTLRICKLAVMAGESSKLADQVKAADMANKGENSTCDYSRSVQQSDTAVNLYKMRADRITGELIQLRRQSRDGSSFNQKVLEDQRSSLSSIADLEIQKQAGLRLENLNKEKKALWGKDPTGPDSKDEAGSATYDKTAFFGKLLTLMEDEKTFLNKDEYLMAQSAANLHKLSDSCKNPLPANPNKILSTPPTSEITGNATGASTMQGNCTAQYDPTSARMQVNGAICPGQGGNISVSPGARTGAETPDAAGPTKKAHGGDAPNADLDTHTNTTPPPKPTTDDEPGFFSKNSGLLIVGGVGAAAVAGAILYQKHEQSVDSNAALDVESDGLAWKTVQQQKAAAAAAASSSTTSNGVLDPGTDSYVGGTSAATQAPVGSTLMVTGIPAGASVGVPITTITVKIIGPNGVMTQDSATAISVSCANPVPCPLTGTLTLTSLAGKVTYSDLQFTSAVSSVQLQFSASGFSTVTSPNTFTVSAQ